MRHLARVREALRGLLRRSGEDAETAAEMAFHLEMEAERLVREEGLSPAEAQRRAAIRFGGVEKHAEEVRLARGLGWVSGLALDFRLGGRMLVKYPGLTIVGGLGMAVGIALSAGFFAMTWTYIVPDLPLPHGDRLVGIEIRDVERGEPASESLHELAEWRQGLRTVEQLSAFSTQRRNLIIGQSTPQVVHVAAMTASGFGLGGAAPVLGRTVVPEDERPGAPPVVVIGYDVWQNRFGGDPSVIGRSLRLGSEQHTIIGVMPEGYRFPRSFSLWTALASDPTPYERGAGPSVFLFGRLAEGATEEQARAEVTAAGERLAAAWPQSHGTRRAELVRFVASFGPVSTGGSMVELYLAQLFVSLLLVVVAVNVAVLVYARTATRQGEIAVRSALGASRARIAGQLFLEALVLAVVAAIGGLVIAGLALRWMYELLRGVAEDFGGLPFWIRPDMPAGTLVLVLLLVIFTAAVIGLLPALQATGQGLQNRLRQLGGGGGPRLGRTWTVMIVAQVAFAVAILPPSLYVAWQYAQYGFRDPGFPADEYLTTSLEMDREAVPSAEAAAYDRAFEARYADRGAELMRRLEAEPGVAAVALAQDVPGHESGASVEIQGSSASGEVLHEVRVGRVDGRWLPALGAAVLAGRGFNAADVDTASRAVVVNAAFVEHVLGGGDPLGRLVRYGGDEPGPWHEIVGVVSNVPAAELAPGSTGARMYHPLAPGHTYPATLLIRMRGDDPAGFIPRLRQLMAALDPTLRPQETLPLDVNYRSGEQALMRMGALAIALVMLSVLLLSAAGIYALMSFTVTRRRREIGIRAALGADPRRILAGIFSRAAAQLAVGTLLGGAIAAAMFHDLTGEPLLGGTGITVLGAVALILMTVGLLAALGPARRGLRVEPTEALRD